MRRIGILMSLALLLLSSPSLIHAAPNLPMSHAAMLDELPWATVDAVLKRVAEQGTHTYSQLVEWYQVSLLTVEQSGSSYVVTIYDEDGIVSITVIDNL